MVSLLLTNLRPRHIHRIVQHQLPISIVTYLLAIDCINYKPNIKMVTGFTIMITTWVHEPRNQTNLLQDRWGWHCLRRKLLRIACQPERYDPSDLCFQLRQPGIFQLSNQNNDKYKNFLSWQKWKQTVECYCTHLKYISQKFGLKYIDGINSFI